MDFAKFRIAPVEDTVGNNISGAMEQIAESPDWAEHHINIRTVPKPNDYTPTPNSPSVGTMKMHLIFAADVSSSDAVGSVVAAEAYNVPALSKLMPPVA